MKVLFSMTAIKVLRSRASGTCSWESQGDPPSYGNPTPASTLPETNIAPENRSSRGKNKRNETKPANKGFPEYQNYCQTFLLVSEFSKVVSFFNSGPRLGRTRKRVPSVHQT